MLEYVKLVALQLRSRKVVRKRDVKGGGTVFGVAKKGTDKVREVWDGSRVSDSCIPPPKLPMLAIPCSFPRLEVAPGSRLLMSKKDCRCFFDQLALPKAIQPFTGRPPILIKELIDICGMTSDEIASFLPDGARARPDDVYYPVSRVWCMGFAWSSFVAQSTLLYCCRASGLKDSICLCDERPTPKTCSEAYALATDDVMHFTTCGPDLAKRRMDALDQALVDNGIEKHPLKDLLAATDGTCIGVDLSDGQFFTAHGPRLALLLVGVVELIRVGSCSPRQLHAVLGVAQWMCLLNRPLFASLDSSYGFTRLVPEHEQRVLGTDVLAELALIIYLAPYFEADLRRPWSSFLAATDASVEFGFGASIAKCTIHVARQVGRLAETRGAYVRLSRDGGPTDEPE